MLFVSLKDKVLILSAFLLERKFDLREIPSLDRNDYPFSTLGVIPFSLEMTFSSWCESPKMRGIGVYL